MSKTSGCAATAHDFDKFDDATIYCRRCGEQRVMDVQALIAKLPQPVYLPCPGPHWYPVYPTWTPNVTWGTVTVTSDSATYEPNISTMLTSGASQ